MLPCGTGVCEWENGIQCKSYRKMYNTGLCRFKLAKLKGTVRPDHGTEISLNTNTTGCEGRQVGRPIFSSWLPKINVTKKSANCCIGSTLRLRESSLSRSASIITSSVADPGSGAFLTPGSGIRNRFFPDPGSQTHIFESLVTIFWVKSSIILVQFFLSSALQTKIIFNLVKFVAA
jgi:hypothetical protein